MSKPLDHAKNSVKRFGGAIDDYLEIHNKMDSTKAAHAEMTHRCVFHSAFGIFLIEELFGVSIVNAAGREISVRDIAEQHVLDDLGFIPSLSDWMKEMKTEPWMAGARKHKIVLVD